MNDSSTFSSEQRLVDFKRIVEGYLLSIVCICGLLGNALTCVILSSRVMRSSPTNIYIFALSCASSCVLIGFLLTHGIRSTFNAEDFYQHIFTRVFPVHVTCILIQIYLTATVAVDRFILICLPFRSQKWRTPSSALIVVMSVSLFCIVYCIPFWFEFTLISTNTTTTITISSFGNQPIFRLLMRKYLYFVFVFLIPLSIIFLCKTMIIRELYRLRKRKRILGNFSKRSRSSNAINFLLLSIVFIFLITQLPYFVFNVLYALRGPNLMSNLLARQYLSINNLLSVINASSTFILYAFFGKKFRQVGAHLLFCKPLPPGFDVHGGATRTSTPMRGASVVTLSLKSRTSSIPQFGLQRHSSTVTNHSLYDSARQALLDKGQRGISPPPLTTQHLSRIEESSHMPTSI